MNDRIFQVEGLGQSYATGAGPRRVLENVDFDVARGAFVCIVGPSGAGKTTLLRCLSGLQQPTQGRVLFEGQAVTSPPAGLALVFQDYSRSLMPWLSVHDNVALPLKAARVPRTECAERSRQALEEVGLGGAGDRFPWQLSGGMQQRVAIARALAYRPAAVLMDEPFASVDAQTRADLEDLVLRVRERLGISVLLVTHDIDEAVYLSDEVVVLGGSPGGVVARIPVSLGGARDQIATKASREFAELRTRVYQLIRRAPAGQAGEVAGA